MTKELKTRITKLGTHKEVADAIGYTRQHLRKVLYPKGKNGRRATDEFLKRISDFENGIRYKAE